MARDTVKIWYDPEGDYLEVIFDQRPGNVLGFSVLKVSALRGAPLEVAL